MRLSAMLLALPALACAQIQDLATTDDGGQTYFSTAYRQKGTTQASYLKIFRIAENGLQLFRQLDYLQYYPGGDTNFYLAQRPSLSGDGRVVAYNASRGCVGGSHCVFFTVDEAFVTGSPDKSLGLGGRIVVSPDGRSYMLFNAQGTPGPPLLTLGDPIAGPTMIVTGCSVIGDGRQTLANGPVALLSCNGYVLWKAGQTTPLALPSLPKNARLDANADMIVYEVNSELHSYSVPSATDLLLATGAVDFHPWITRDGTQVSYILNNQLYVQSTSGGPARALTDPSDGVIVDATISGWDNVAFAATSFGRLLRIDVATGNKTELIAPVPDLQVTFGQPAPGGLFDVTLAGPADGDPAIVGAGTAGPVVGKSDNVVTLQVPWEATFGSTVSLVVPGNQSAFEEVHELQVVAGVPTFYTLPDQGNIFPPIALAVHSDFSALVTDSNPARPGEIVHMYATDLGSVSPPIATGAITPTGTLYTLQTPFTCNFQQGGALIPAQIPFVGLAPGMIGIYQLDIIVPAQATGPAIQLDCESGQPIGTISGFAQLPVASK